MKEKTNKKKYSTEEWTGNIQKRRKEYRGFRERKMRRYIAEIETVFEKDGIFLLYLQRRSCCWSRANMEKFPPVAGIFPLRHGVFTL